MTTITVIGDGEWGTALAQRFAESGCDVLVNGLAKRKRMPKGISYTSSMEKALAHSERLIVTVPIDCVEKFFKAAAPYLRCDHRIVSTARGLTPKRQLRASEVIRAETAVRQIAVLAGAADARALKCSEPVALVVGSPFRTWVHEIQSLLSSDSLRVYANPDLVGVELANIAATVLGVILGAARRLNLGPPTEATALTRALAEMERVISHLGGRSGTAYGLAGLGVLGEMVYSGTGAAFMAGAHFVDEEPKKAQELVEVREATRTLSKRIQKHGVYAPLIEVVHQLFEGTVEMKSAVSLLMERPQMNEYSRLVRAH